MQPLEAARTRDVIRPEQGALQPVDDLGCDAGVLVEQRGDRLVHPVCLDLDSNVAGRCCNAPPRSSRYIAGGLLLTG